MRRIGQACWHNLTGCRRYILPGLIAISICSLAATAPGLAAEKGAMGTKKGTAWPRLKIGQAVPLSMCQADPYKCFCPKNGEGITYRAGRGVQQFVCINAVCKTGQARRIRVTKDGSHEGVCEGG